MSELQTEVDGWNRRFADADPGAILEWAAGHFGDRLVATSSFQSQSMPLLHLISRHAGAMRVCFLDTGFHFEETSRFVERVRSELGIRVDRLTPLLGHDAFLEKYGPLHQSDPAMCCYLNKVEPMTRALIGMKAWISGVRGDQTKVRGALRLFNLQPSGVVKICPLLHWSEPQIEDYLREHSLPRHPLFEAGYRSIGCAPCTVPVGEGEDPRSGRWAGSMKTECGLHTRL